MRLGSGPVPQIRAQWFVLSISSSPPANRCGRRGPRSLEVEDGRARPPAERAHLLVEPQRLAALHDVGLQADPVSRRPSDVQTERERVGFVPANDRQEVLGGDAHGHAWSVGFGFGRLGGDRYSAQQHGDGDGNDSYNRSFNPCSASTGAQQVHGPAPCAQPCGGLRGRVLEPVGGQGASRGAGVVRADGRPGETEAPRRPTRPGRAQQGSIAPSGSH